MQTRSSVVQFLFKYSLLVAAGLSIFLHVSSVVVLDANAPQKKKKLDPAKITIVEPEKPQPVSTPTPQKKEPPKPKPKTPAPKANKPNPKVTPVQGLPPDAFKPGATGISAPVGNTLMAPDEGKRLTDVKPLEGGDLSADPKLIRDSIVTPQYTDAAIDAALEGLYIVDVNVNEKGEVTSVELRKKIGYGMDERVLAAARNARFTPRKNQMGAAISGAAEIKFNLQIP